MSTGLGKTMTTKSTPVFLALLFSLPINLFAQNSSAKTFDDPRPLISAVRYLQNTYRIAINYEDPPLEAASDIVDATDQVQSARQRLANPLIRLLVPRGGKLELPAGNLGIRTGVPSDAMTVLARLIASHEAAGLLGKFTLGQVAGVPTIVPFSVKNTKGEWVPTVSIFSERITIPVIDRTAAQLTELILNEIAKKRGVKVGLASAPVQLFVSTHVKLGGTDVEAGVMLSQLFQELSSKAGAAADVQNLLCYRALFDPQVRYYLVTISPVLLLPPPPGNSELVGVSSGKFGGV